VIGRVKLSRWNSRTRHGGEAVSILTRLQAEGSVNDGLGLKQLLTIRDSGQVDLVVEQKYTAAVSSGGRGMLHMSYTSEHDTIWDRNN